MHDLVRFRRSEAPTSGETITSWSEVSRIVYPFDRHQEGVDHWNCIMGCVSVRRTWENTKTSFIPCYHKISSGLPKVGVLSCEWRTFSCGVGVVYEACHTLEFDTLSLNHQPHIYRYIWDTSMIWLDSDALKPREGEALNQMERVKLRCLPLWPASRGGSAVEFFAWLC